MESPRLEIDPSHVAKIEQVKPQAAAAAQSIDAALIHEIWPYVRPRERFPSAGMIAQQGVELA